jgi:VanZ family protein
MKTSQYPEHSPPADKSKRKRKAPAKCQSLPNTATPQPHEHKEPAKLKSKNNQIAKRSKSSTALPEKKRKNPLDSLYHIIVYFCNGLVAVAKHHPNEVILMLLLLVLILFIFKTIKNI